MSSSPSPEPSPASRSEPTPLHRSPPAAPPHAVGAPDRSSAFGALLRRQRMLNGLTQEMLAERAGLSVRGISDLERGKRSPRAETLRLLAEALALDPAVRAAWNAAAMPVAAMPVAAAPIRAVPAPERAMPPAAPTPILGRDAEVAAVVDLLRQPDVRLVTLTGPGGTGKTRLAIELARRLAPAFADGIRFVPLAGVRDPALVVAAIGQALGVEAGDRTPAQALHSALRDRHLLLILDNVEQVVAAAPDVAGLLVACPDVKALVTSRERLRLRGERLFPVPPLPTPGDDAAATAGAAMSYAAIELFAARTRDVRPDFSLTAENAAGIAAICRRLDGLPLAIELAAAWASVFAPDALLARLDQRLPLLTGGARDLPERLQTMRGAIAWSYDLLPPGERALFRRLSVFAGGFDLAAAAALGGMDGAGEPAVVEGVAALVDKSLLRRLDAGDGGPRFGLLETVREFGLEELAARGELAAARDAHAAYVLALAEEAEPHLRGADQVAWFGRLTTDHDNVRAALAWLRERGDAERGLRLGGALWFFWWMRGHYAEGRSQLDALLALPGADVVSPARAKALNGAGVPALWQGDAARAETLHTEALAVARAAGDRSSEAFALLALGTTLMLGRSDYDRGTVCIQESLALCRELGDAWGICGSLTNLAIVASVQGDDAGAEAMLAESIALGRASGDRWNLGLALRCLGTILLDRGDYAGAAVLFEEGAALAREVGDKRGIAGSLADLGYAVRRSGDGPRAAALLSEAVAVAEAIGDVPTTAATLHSLGIVLKDQGDRTGAVAVARRSLVLFREVGDRLGVASCLATLADLGGPAAATTRLLGAAAAFRRAIGASPSPEERADQDRIETAARAALGPTAYTAAWDAGGRLSLDEAVGEALAVAASDRPASAPGVPAPAAPAQPDHGLSARELEVLRLIAQGMPDREIAAMLFVSRRTVNTHVGNILNKLDVPSRAAAVGALARGGHI